MDIYAFARAADVMSTRSAIGFEWSIKLNGVGHFYVGIASQVVKQDSWIIQIDQNAILYHSDVSSPVIKIGNNTILSNLTQQKAGDVIHFEFRPKTKKLVIELVRV